MMDLSIDKLRRGCGGGLNGWGTFCMGIKKGLYVHS